MTAALLLALFQPFFQGGYLDTDKPGVQDLLRTLPADEKVYIAIAEEAFADCVHNVDDPSYLSFERTVDILRALLYLDGRSELGLLRIAELAFANPPHAIEATNALAALASHYRSGGLPSLPPQDLIQRFEKYMENPDIFHNARECRNALWAQEKAPSTKPECPEPELPEATIRSIGYVAVRDRDPKMPPTPPSNIRITRYECNYLYTEVFAPDTIGGYVTVVISPDGRVLDVLPSL
jgi:hypothetical protein